MKNKGLFGKYRILKADGSPVNPQNEYFVLKVAGVGDERHIAACRKAVLVYADEIESELPLLAKDLRRLYLDIATQPQQDDGEKCNDCGKIYLDVYATPDDVWKQIHERAPAGLLCPTCAWIRFTIKAQGQLPTGEQDLLYGFLKYLVLGKYTVDNVSVVQCVENYLEKQPPPQDADKVSDEPVTWEQMRDIIITEYHDWGFCQEFHEQAAKKIQKLFTRHPPQGQLTKDKMVMAMAVVDIRIIGDNMLPTRHAVKEMYATAIIAEMKGIKK